MHVKYMNLLIIYIDIDVIQSSIIVPYSFSQCIQNSYTYSFIFLIFNIEQFKKLCCIYSRYMVL